MVWDWGVPDCSGSDLGVCWSYSLSLFGGIEVPGKPDLSNIQKLDLLPLGMIRRMMRVGAPIDREYLWNLSLKLQSRKQELSQEIASYVPLGMVDQYVGESDEDDSDLTLNPESSPQIARLLFEQLRIGSRERLKRTKSGSRISTGKKQLETLKHRHPVIPLILEYRECSKLDSTYCSKLPLIARQDRDGIWRVHTTIVTTRTDTGRLASRDPNLQNIPARTELGREVRAAFIPSPGRKLISVDYSQIELRLLGHCADEPNMLRIFAEGGDIHLDTAMRAFGITDPKLVDKNLHRAPCKNVNFGVGYGLGPPGLYDLMAITFATAKLQIPKWMTLEWCTEFIEKWFDLYPKCRDYFELQHYRARRYGIVWTMFGRVRRVPEVMSSIERVRAAGLRQAGNMPIQGVAADIMKIGMARVERLLSGWREAGVYVEALLPIHDELLIEADEGYAEEIEAGVELEMASAMDGFEMRCPVLADGKVMDRWLKG